MGFVIVWRWRAEPGGHARRLIMRMRRVASYSSINASIRGRASVTPDAAHIVANSPAKWSAAPRTQIFKATRQKKRCVSNMRPQISRRLLVSHASCPTVHKLRGRSAGKHQQIRDVLLWGLVLGELRQQIPHS